MSDAAAPSWIAAAEPPVPDAFAGWLEGPEVGADDGGPGVDALLEAAMEALERALGDGDGPRGDREGAFELLAADGLLTYACEAALDEDDPEAVLRRIVARVAGVGHGASGGA